MMIRMYPGRRFVHQHGLSSLLSFGVGLLLVTLAGAATAGEVRGLWVVRTGLLSPAEVDRVVDQAADAGFNALLVQVRGRGDAYYNSQILPRSSLLDRQPRDFDPLARILERAHGRGLSVHAWVNVLLSADFSLPLPAGHELVRHPEWMAIPRQVAAQALHVKGAARRDLVRGDARGSDAEGFYLSPWAPGVAQHLESIVRELVTSYALDGLHFDFIRLPSPDYDYSHPALLAFRPGRAGRELLSAPSVEPQAWDEQRSAGVSAMATRMAAAARAARPGLLVTAAVVPDRATAISQKFQDWPAWLTQGTLDAVCPMVYTTEDRIFKRQVQDARAAAGSGRQVWAGIGAFRLNVDGVIQKLRLARAAGADGVVIFSHESLRQVDLTRLRDAFLEVPGAPTPAAATAPTARGASSGW